MGIFSIFLLIFHEMEDDFALLLLFLKEGRLLIRANEQWRKGDSSPGLIFFAIFLFLIKNNLFSGYGIMPWIA